MGFSVRGARNSAAPAGRPKAGKHRHRRELALRTVTLLTPHEPLSRAKQRAGAATDGGYVVLTDPDIGFVMSYGVGPTSTFEQHFVELGVPVFMFDMTVSGTRLDHPLATFVREGVAPVPDPSAAMDTVDAHLHRFGLTGRRDGLLQMDVEGAEWDVLDAISTETLLNFRQIVLELHHLQRIHKNPQFSRVLEKLTERFYLVHIHANSLGMLVDFADFSVPSLLEVTFVRKDLVEVGPNQTVFPTELDYPNRPGTRDQVMNSFPWLPTSLRDAELSAKIEACVLRLAQRAEG
ncbi:MAG: FkbM family methyltransferase [Pseudomonadota bacterium]